MIMSRYRFGPTLPNVTQRDIDVTDRYRILPLLALQALPILGLLKRYLKFYKKINVTLVTLVTQVTVTFGNGGERSVTVGNGNGTKS